MAIKQSITYYEDFSIKTYRELHDDVLVLEERYDQLGNVLYKWQLKETGYSTEKFDARGNFTFTRSYKLLLNMLTGEPRLKYLYWKKFKYDNQDRLIYTLENNGWWERYQYPDHGQSKIIITKTGQREHPYFKIYQHPIPVEHITVNISLNNPIE